MAELTLVGLRVVLEVGRTGSFSAASERLGYTQSAISRQIAVTESIVGSALFERHARGVRPTAAGEVLIRHAGRVLDDVTAAGQELAGLRDRLVGRLVVGAFPTAAADLLPRAIARLLAVHPGVRVQLSEASTPAQLQALRRRRLEVAVVATGDDLPSYDLSGLRLTELRGTRGPGVAVADSHPFAAREYVTTDDLVDQQWIVGAGVGDAPEFGAWPGVEQPRIAFTARNWPTRLGLVAANLGIALVPGLAAPTMPRGVRWIPVHDHGLQRRMHAATGSRPSATAVAMVEALRQEIGSGPTAHAPLTLPRRDDATLRRRGSSTGRPPSVGRHCVARVEDCVVDDPDGRLGPSRPAGDRHASQLAGFTAHGDEMDVRTHGNVRRDGRDRKIGGHQRQLRRPVLNGVAHVGPADRARPCPQAGVAVIGAAGDPDLAAELRDVDARKPSETVPGADGDEQVPFGQRGQPQRRGAVVHRTEGLPLRDHGKVERAVAQSPDERGRAGLTQRHDQVRMSPPESGQSCRHEAAGGKGEGTQTHGRGTRRFRRITEGGVQIVECPGDAGHEPQPGGSQAHAVLLALEQRLACRRLQGSDLAGHG